MLEEYFQLWCCECEELVEQQADLSDSEQEWIFFNMQNRIRKRLIKIIGSNLEERESIQKLRKKVEESKPNLLKLVEKDADAVRASKEAERELSSQELQELQELKEPRLRDPSSQGVKIGSLREFWEFLHPDISQRQSNNPQTSALPMVPPLSALDCVGSFNHTPRGQPFPAPRKVDKMVNDEKYNLILNNALAEFIGIMLGDGSIGIYSGGQHQLDIVLNYEDEPKYVNYVIGLMEGIFKKKISFVERPDTAAVSLRYYDKRIINSLLQLGLKTGNKRINQVGVPDFILKNKSFNISCLKGLFDTDGSFTINNSRLLLVKFTSTSQPLAHDFFKMCLKIDIHPSPTINFLKDKKAWIVIIAKKAEVKKFLEIIKPEKFLEPYRRIWLACQLIYLNISEQVRIRMKREILTWLKQTSQHRFAYSKRNSQFLKRICEKYQNKTISDKIVDQVLAESLEKERIFYDKEQVKWWKFLYEKLRSFERVAEYLSYKGVPYSPYKDTVMYYLRRYFRETNQNYNVWLKENPSWRITLNESREIANFPRELRNFLCFEIMKELNKHGIKVPNSNILQEIKKEFINSDILIMNFMLVSPKYKTAIEKYLLVLIDLMKKIVEAKGEGTELNKTKILRELNYPFTHREFRKIINYLIKSKALSLQKK